MKAISVQYDPDQDRVRIPEEPQQEAWDEVCERFDNDVHRIRDVSDPGGYSGLYVCYDDRNRPVHYLVAETAALFRLKRKISRRKLGRDSS